MNRACCILAVTLAGIGAVASVPPPVASRPNEAAFSRYPPRLQIGRIATPEEIARWNIAIPPDGRGLPPGSGTAAQGATVFLTKCAACHGMSGEGMPNLGSRLIGPATDKFEFGLSPQSEAQKTVGNYWPYATTLFDYTRRAMPSNAPGSLTADEVYAVTAYLLAKNRIIGETDAMNAQTLPRVRMPTQPRFVPDNRLESNRVK